MPVAVGEKTSPVSKFDSQVDEQIAQATGRIRAHDLTLGGLTLAALVAVYVTVMIVCDRYLNLAEWIRQLALTGFLVILAAVAYWLLVRPLWKRINPLYAASRVEKTIDDAKNSVTGYVEAQEKGEVHAAVKAAMSAKAAKAVGDADVNRAVDHRSLVMTGAVLLAFLLALAVLFFVFRPAQFSSLAGRALAPFSSDPIAKRTQIQILKPDPLEPTITTGQTINVAVHIQGKVPSRNNPDRVRVLVRHNPADPSFEEIAMEQGETTRDWQVKVPDYLVQNGFYYKVAAGDNETPEYRVTVRTLPMFEEYSATYEYPAYTRKPSDRSTGPNLRAYKGTKITLTARTNREVADGQLRFDAAGLPPVAGRPVPGKADSLEFKFTAAEPARYRLFLTSTSGERNAEAPSFPISIDADLAPTVLVTKPEDAEIALVSNGQLKVDGTIGDDFGIDKVRLRLRHDGRDLAAVPYMKGQSFLRATDNTWPTDLEFKLSAELAALTYADGAKFQPQFNAEQPVVLDYWVEAIDNCAEAKPVLDWDKQVGNVGRSNIQRVRLTPPEMAPERQQDLNRQRDQRSDEERQHNQQQQERLNKEERKKPEPQDGKEPDKKNETQAKKDGTDPNTKKDSEPGMGKGPPEAKKGPDEGKQSDMTKQPGGGMPPDKGKGGNTDHSMPPKKDETKGKTDPTMSKVGTDPSMPPKKDETKGMNDPTMSKGGTDPSMPPKKDETKGMNDPTTPKEGPPMSGMPMGGGMNTEPRPTSPMPKTPEDRKTDEDADKVKNEINKDKAPGGDAKPNNTANADENRVDPAKPKPQPPQDGMGMEPQSKPEPKPGETPKGGGDRNGAAEAKPQGKLEERPSPDSGGKPGPKPSDEMKPNERGAQPSESRSEPLGGTPGQDKPEPKEDPKAPPMGPKPQNTDAASGSAAKPATQKPEPKGGEPGGMPNEQPNPAERAAKPKPNSEPQRGEDKDPTGQPAGQNEVAKNNPEAGEAKPERAPPSAEAKPKSGDPMAGKAPDSNTPKPAPTEAKSPNDPKTDNASEFRPDAGMPPKTGTGIGGMKDDKNLERGEDKPSEQAGGGAAPQPKDKDQFGDNKGKDGKGGKKDNVDAARQKEIDKAIQDLTDPDPKTQQAARDKLDKQVGKDTRELIEQGEKQRKAEWEQLQKDLKSPDKATAEAAKKKLDDIQRRADEMAKKAGGEDGRKLTEEEINDLVQKARDLNSPDEGKRRAAEKAIDDKIGKEEREKLQEEIKKREEDFKKLDPEQQKEVLKKLEEMARKSAGVGKGPIQPKHEGVPAASADPLMPGTDGDPRHRARTAQLQLEEFEKHRYDKDLHDRLGWDRDRYEDFLKAARERADTLAKEADNYAEELRNRPESALGDPKYNFGGGGKVDFKPNLTKVEVSGSGAVVPPPGFENVRPKFQPKSKKQ